MPKDDLVYVGHALDNAQEALSLVEGKGRDDYDRDRTLRLALTYLIQIIGEAARRVSQNFRARHPRFPGRILWECGIRSRMTT